MTDKKKDKTVSHSDAGDAASGAGPLSHDELDALMRACGVPLMPEAAASQNSQGRSRASDDVLLECLSEVEAEYEACVPEAARPEQPAKKRETRKAAKTGAKAAEAAVASASAAPFVSDTSPVTEPASASAPQPVPSADDLIAESLAAAREEFAEQAPRVKSPAKRRSRKASASRATSGASADQAPSDGSVPGDSADAEAAISGSDAGTFKASSAEVAKTADVAASSALAKPRIRRVSSPAKKSKIFGFSEFPEAPETLDAFDDPDDLGDLEDSSLSDDFYHHDASDSQDPLAQVMAEMAEEEEPLSGYVELDEHDNLVWKDCEPDPEDPLVEIAKAMLKKGEFAPSLVTPPAASLAASPSVRRASCAAAASSASSGSGALAPAAPGVASATEAASTADVASVTKTASAATAEKPAKPAKPRKVRAARSTSATAPVGLRETPVVSKDLFDEYSVKPGVPKNLSDSVREKVEELADVTPISFTEPHEVFEYAKTPLSPVMMIEASAGTGKTYALERLVLRFIVEKEVLIESFLIVTFTKAATGELKERVRAILKSAQTALRAAALESPDLFNALAGAGAGTGAGAAAGLNEESGDAGSADCGGSEEGGAGEDDADVLQRASGIHFADDSLEQLWALWLKKGVASKALARITAALEEFDRCAIFTIHSFCQKMLQAWAFSSGADFDTEVGDDKAILEGVFDAFKRYWLSSPDFADDPEAQKKLIGLDCGALLEGLLLHPGCKNSLAFPDAVPPMTRVLEDFASRIPEEIDAAKRRAGVMSFNDILLRMAKAVSGSAEFRANVGSQFHAVLVDEFQDTDSLQYQIFKELFLDKAPQGFKGAVFVGDPKQSIYKFRGAEIGVYLRAREAIALRKDGKILTLKTNYRTTPAVVDSVSALFGAKSKEEDQAKKEDQEKGEEKSRFGAGITCPFVESNANLYPLFQKEPETGALKPLSAFEFWTSDWEEGGKRFPGDAWLFEHYTGVEDRREAEAELVANDIASLLSSETYVGKRLADPEAPLSDARLKPGDIAILVKKHTDADIVQKALFDRGIRCIHTKKNDVFATEEARDLLAILKALADPGARKSVNAARATPVVGRRLKDIALTGDDAADAALNDLYLEDLKCFRDASDRCRKAGPAAAIERLFASFDTVGRVLGKKGGERLLTNWTHITELLSVAYGRLKTLPSLIGWYEGEVVRAFAAPGKDASDERALRVESDESLVRIETVYASKGLEYPVVYAVGAGDAEASLKKGPAFVPRDVAALTGGKIPGKGPLGVGGYAYYLGLDAKVPDGAAELAALEAELARIAYVWATRASARFVLPLLPNYRGVGKPGRGGKRTYSFSNTGNVWMKLLAGDVKAADPRKGRKPGEKAVPEKVTVNRIKAALEDLKKKLVNHSTFLMKSAPAQGKRFAMADALEKAAADLPAPAVDSGSAGLSEAALSDPLQEKCGLLLEAAAALRSLPDTEPLAHVRFFSRPEIDAMPFRALRAAKDLEAAAKAAGALAPVAVLPARPVPSAWRSSSYSSITRGFDVAQGAIEAAAGGDDLSGGREGDESYETESTAAPYQAPMLPDAVREASGGTESAPDSARGPSNEGFAKAAPQGTAAGKKLQEGDASSAAARAVAPCLDPAFLAGGKDTGDAVHNLFEACVREGLHRAPQRLRDPEEEEGDGSGGEDGASSGDVFLRVFNRTPGARLLFRKVRHPGAAPGRQPDEEDRRLALLWIRDRIRGTFETDWLGGEGGGLRLSESPAGCASPELAFSMRVKTGLPPDEFARRILALNARLPKDSRLPLAEFKSDSGRHPLKGFLEGRIDLLFQARDGRFWLADWKTDQPGAGGHRSYAGKAMREVMVREKYGWQALFYLVALMRLLRGAYGETGEEAFERIGGMAYVFVRGFSHAYPAKDPAAVILKPAAELVLAADRLLESEEN